jgi:hypothetical protein
MARQRAASHSAWTSRPMARAQRFSRATTDQAAESRSAAAASTSKLA